MQKLISRTWKTPLRKVGTWRAKRWGCMLVRTHQTEGVLTLELCRADKRNALSSALVEALAAALDEFRESDIVTLAVLRGEGDRAFASGGDLKELADLRTLAQAKEMSTNFRAVFERIRDFPVPVIGALNGDALGGGAELAMSCDLRIAAAHARLGFLQGKLAISTAWGGGVDLMAAVGTSRGLRMLARAEILSSDRALDWGLVDAVAEPGQPFDAFIAQYVAAYAGRTPAVMRAFKAMARAARIGTPRAEMLALETEHFAKTWVHDDHWSAVEASLGRAGKS